MFGLCILAFLSVIISYILHYFPLTAMAGLAPEGSQFDSRQYDAKMNEM